MKLKSSRSRLVGSTSLEKAEPDESLSPAMIWANRQMPPALATGQFQLSDCQATLPA